MPELTLKQALAELPDTADGIADRMRSLGIKGRQDAARRCPIACWLKAEGFLAPLVEDDSATAGGNDWKPLPPAVAEFVRRFDAGVYLDLVEVP